MATYDYTGYYLYYPTDDAFNPDAYQTIETFEGTLDDADGGDQFFEVGETLTADSGSLEVIYLGIAILPLDDSLTTYGTFIVTVGAPGTALEGYHILFTTVDNPLTVNVPEFYSDVPLSEVTLVTCFTRGTRLATLLGERLVEDLEVGDLIQTVDGRAVPIRWIGSTKVSASRLARDESLRPVRFAAGSLGGGLPKRDMLVSPQHGIHVTDWRAEMLFDTTEVLVPAINLVNDDTIRQVSSEDGVEYFHILCDEHELVATEGYPTETYFPDLRSRAHTLSEIETLFPDLAARIESGEFAEATVRIGSMKTAALKELGA